MIQDGLRDASVHTSLPDGELVFYTMSGYEALGQLFRYELQLLSENPEINLSELLGEPISVSLRLPHGESREFNGVVSHCAFDENVGRYFLYRVTVRPWIWILGNRARSRIFQNEKVPDVIERLFREHGFSDFENALTDEYRRLDYLVQYRESDLRFITRLMELEGIYFFFKHEGRQHKLVLADSYSAHDRAAGYESVPYYPPRAGERRERDHINRWRALRTMRPGTYAARDFNFTRPAAPVLAENSLPLDHAYNDYEVYDYPGKFLDASEAEVQCRVRREELQVGFEQMRGEGNARGLGCGNLFSLEEFPRSDQNREYLVTQAEYGIRVADYDSTDRGEEAKFHVGFLAMESRRPYRAPRRTPKPVVEGPQTATVVGQAGQEIWTDEYGRVRLHFHWDREGNADETSSCWVRVSQAWAGMNWGSIHIPRIGQEVIVSFLDGDPDRPIVTGRVYNADNMPPYALPDNQTQSGIKSRSTKGGTPDNFNEIRFEDKKGEEQIFIQAEKDMATVVKNNHSISAGATQSISSGGDQSISTQSNQSVSVSGTRSVTVTKADTQTFEASRTTSVGETDDLTVTGAHTGTYETGRTLTVSGANDALTVDGANREVTVNGEFNTTATTHYKVTQGANELFLKAPLAKLTNGKCVVSLDGGNATIDAPEQIQIKCGGSTITLTTSGIDVAATKITLNGGATIELASAGATVSGGKVSIAGTATTEISGAMVKIN